jgi:hypothetical protein
MTTKKQHGSGQVRKGVSTPETKVLYVELAAADHERYKALADKLGMTMRDFARLALDTVTNTMNVHAQRASTGQLPNQLSAGEVERAHSEMNARRRELANIGTLTVVGEPQTTGVSFGFPSVLEHAERISRLEAEVARIREIVDGLAP